MIIYKDRFTGDEIGSDSYPQKLVDEVVYEIDGKRISEKLGVSDNVIGGNPSAEDGAEGIEDGEKSGINIVMAHELMELSDWDKKTYISYAKKYMKELVADVDKRAGKEKADVLKAKLQEVFTKKIVPNLKNFQFFVGPNFVDGEGNEKGMVVLMDYREDGVTPYFIYFKDGIEEEKQ